MPISKKGTNFKEFAATLRYPPLQFDNPNTTDPLQTPRAQLLKNFATDVLSDVLDDMKENGLEFYANEYNKKPFKNYKQKVKEDEELKRPVNKAAKAALINQSNLEAGDPFAQVLNDIIDSMTDNITLDGNGVFAKNDNGARARELLLKSMSENSLKLLGFLSLSALSRTLAATAPLDWLLNVNVKEYLKYLSPTFLIEKLIASIKDKQVSEAINDFKLIGRFINGVLTSTQFEPRVQQAFMDYLAEQPNIPPALKEIKRFDEITAFLDPEAINEFSDANSIRTLSSVSLDLLQNGKLGIDLNIISRDINGEVLGQISINNLSKDLTGLISGAQDDLRSLLDSFAACELPDPNMFNKYRELDKARKEFFKGFKGLKKKDQKKKLPKVPDRYEIIKNLLLTAATSLFYVATKTLFKIVISYLQNLVPDLSCSQLSLMILPEEELGPRTQNRPVNPDDLARQIASSMRTNNRNGLTEADIQEVSVLLSEIATSIGLFNGVDIAALNEFLSLTMSVLTQREFCELLNGQPNYDTVLIIQNIIDVKYPNSGISKDQTDIIRFFSSISSLVDPGCNSILSEVDVPLNGMVCSTPAYYQVYNDLRMALLKERGLQEGEIETQISLICELNSGQAQQFLDLINGGDPLDGMLPLIEIGSPNCGINNTIEPINEIVRAELIRTYNNLFSSLKITLDSNMVGETGFLSKILSGKNGLPYPSYLKINELLDAAYQNNRYFENLKESEVDEDGKKKKDEENAVDEAAAKLDKTQVSVYEPKLVASWMRLNQEEFCSLDHKTRMTSTPLNISPEGFDNYIDPAESTFVLTDEDKASLNKLFALSEKELNSLSSQQLINYKDLFARIGNIYFGVRGISYSGIYDLSQSSISGLSVDGIRQVNLESGVFLQKDLNTKLAVATAWAIVNPLAMPFITAFMSSAIKASKNSTTEPLPGIAKAISSKSPAYRVKSYNFFILPSTTLESPVGEIKTKIFDYYPSSISQLLKKDSSIVDTLRLTTNTPEYLEYSQVVPFPENEFNKINKSIELREIIKSQDDYLVDLNEDTINTPYVESILPASNTRSETKQALVFADIVLDALQKNADIQLEDIPRVEKYAEYLSKDLYNYVFNTYLDGMMKIPAYNGKNLKYGVTDERVNVLNSRHVNTVTGELDPVLNPEDYGGTEFDPSYYIYTKLSDDWKNLYNVYLRERNETFTPARTQIPDFQDFAERAAELYLKLKEDTRDADDLSNQAPFDLIVSKSALVSMNGLFDMMVKIFCFEQYYKGFAFLNTVEMSDNVFDNVYFDFLAKRFKEYAVATGPRNSSTTSKSSKFYHMLMEIYVMILLKKREAKIASVTPTEDEALRQIGRKSNIWKFGIPTNNLTQKEASYFEAFSRIATYEVPGYPIGAFSNAIVASGGSLGSANRIFAEAKKQREQQIRLRNNYWNLIMEDCEAYFEVLLRVKIRQEMSAISKELSVLNPDLIKENSILNMPINGGPIVQNGEDIEKDDTAHMRNIYTHHPAMLYSAGNALISDSAYRAFYGTKEDNNDRNFNGFMFTRLYNKQNFSGSTVIMRGKPKEPVYSFSVNYNEDTAAKIEEKLMYENPNGGALTMDDYRYSPDFLVPSLLNYIELNKRDIVVNSFLLDPNSSKAGTDTRWNDLFVFQDTGDADTAVYELETLISEISGNVRVSDYFDSQLPNDPNTNFMESPIRGTENFYTSLKRYKVFKTEGSSFRKLGSDSYVAGGVSASNMPLVMSQVPAPFILEQYVNLVEIEQDVFPGDEQARYRYVDPNTGLDVYTSTLAKLREVLYDESATFGIGYLDTVGAADFKAVTKEVFLGPVSLSAFIYWLGSSGFFNGSFAGSVIDVAGTVSFLDMPISWFFKPGTFRYGVRMLLMQPDSDLTFEEGTHSYFEDTLFPVKEGELDIEKNLRDRIRTLKALNKENGYGIPLFKAEEEVSWTFRDLKTIYDAYLASNTGQGYLGVNVTPGNWIDHSATTRPITIRLFNEIVCSEQYKKMFDFCIPLRYFASLSAIYTTKAFTNSIGSAVDWGGYKRVSETVVNKKETDVLLPFYRSVRKVFYYSYNSFNASYNGEGDDESNEFAEQQKASRLLRPFTNIDQDGITRISEIQSDILKANQVDPLIRQGMGPLRDIIGSGYEGRIVSDPTNACGAAKNSNSCD